MFCSQGCHNRFRGPHSDKTKEKMSIGRKLSYDTPEGLAERHLKSINRKLIVEGKPLLTQDDYYIEIPNVDDLDDDKINW